MVQRIYVEKKEPLRQEAAALLSELQTVLGVSGLTGLRLVNRYDVEGLSPEDFRQAVGAVFSEPQVDDVYAALPAGQTVFAVESLPGQFDQRADSAAQCIQLLTGGERPIVRTARVYLLSEALTPENVEKIKKYVINPVEAREASLDEAETLRVEHPAPSDVETVAGFTGLDKAGLSALLDSMGLAMDLDDLKFLQTHFRDTERRDPTVTEIRVVDTYWSDHCRHTTFSTHIDKMEILDRRVEGAYARYLAAREEVYGAKKASVRPQTLMDIATIGAKALKKRGLLQNLDQSEEINACSIHVAATVDGEVQDWLLMFKNETHNHPTEIEPFGGAATCIGGCIRDPLSGRAYVYQAMRLTGCGDPRVPLSETLSGKLPQRKLAQTAAAGYSSYGNQIGLATGLVNELYHPGYVAKHMEVGAVVGAAPAKNVVRERPVPGDVIILLGGRTGRDGIGGATGASKSHNQKSLTTMASEVQKGNAPEERKIQRLFRDGDVTRLIKRCNDFGAGGVSVAIGELADGLSIDLDAVRKKYEGLDGTELAISESQERMAVVVAPENVEKFITAAKEENLEAYQVAVVTESPRMVMTWQGRTVADLSREFLDTNGAVKHTALYVAPQTRPTALLGGKCSLRSIAADLNTGLQRGLAERFDSTVGAGSVLMPFVGKYQRTPTQVMAALLPVLPGQETEDCSVMSWGCDVFRSGGENCYESAASAVVESLAKLVAAGCDYHTAYLTFQEYFEKLRDDPSRWGKPFSALLGALDAQLAFGVAAIGGKDSMSGSFLDRDVPPTLVSFAIAPEKAQNVLSPAFKEAGHPVYLFEPESGKDWPVNAEGNRANWERFHALCRAGKVNAAWAVGAGSAAEGIVKMSFGNRIGFTEDGEKGRLYTIVPGTIVAELTEDVDFGVPVGHTTAEAAVSIGDETLSVAELLELSEGVLESVYPTRAKAAGGPVPVLEAPAFSRAAPKVGVTKPRVLIPVFPGTNCEYDSARAAARAGLEPELLVVNNQSAQGVRDSVERFVKSARRSQIIFLPGGFSGGDEPDGSGKFITALFRNAAVKDAAHDLLKNRDGLMLGICNGFQALIKLGLVPYGEIVDSDADCPTLTYNVIGRHQSKIVRTRIASNRSPWLSRAVLGGVYTVPISHGEGRFLCSKTLLQQLAENGQIATQYVDVDGNPSMDVEWNPNGSVWAVEGLTSPDGRVFGKMGHAERVGPNLYHGIPGDYNLHLFDAARDYFSI
ncbi:putative phosphoribosylformylglycinamidine synthase [Oscillibacter valericigenes Sjm18-20]|nr:putative phosphoribosylformylglycinamidine synthase [Oscillibacter valericigenes Sjm18-20]